MCENGAAAIMKLGEAMILIFCNVAHLRAIGFGPLKRLCHLRFKLVNCFT